MNNDSLNLAFWIVCRFGDEATMKLCESLMNNRSITVLDLSGDTCLKMLMNEVLVAK